MLFKPRPHRHAQALYRRTLARARDPRFFGEGRIPDTVDGRFEVLIFLLAILSRRLGGEGGSALARDLESAFFADMDTALRELGVGDMSIAKKVKALASALYGRANAYREALDGAEEGALRDALDRNLFSLAPPDAGFRDAVARFARESAAALADQPIEALSSGAEPRFAEAPD